MSAAPTPTRLRLLATLLALLAAGEASTTGGK